MPPFIQIKTRRDSSLCRPLASVQSSSEDRPGIATDTALMPWIIADKVCEEAASYLHSSVPLRFKDHLDAKAERCYASHRQFRKLIRARGNNGRDSLASFMRHWLYAHLRKNYPHLALRLPREYQIGHPLSITVR